MGLSVDEIAAHSGASALSVCRTLLRLIDTGLVRPNGDVEQAKAELRERLSAEMSR